MAFSTYCLLSPNAWDDFPSSFFVLQLIVGAIIFTVILSPIQEIFFRNWHQPQLEGVVGTFGAIIMTSLVFMIWHWFPPFLESGNTSLNLISLVGSISSFLLGLACGVAYSKTRRLLAAWLTHTIAAVTTFFLGKVVFVQFPEYVSEPSYFQKRKKINGTGHQHSQRKEKREYLGERKSKRHVLLQTPRSLIHPPGVPRI